VAETKNVLHQTRRNFHSRDRFTFVKLYKQYVRPHLEFASQAWSPWLTGDKEVLEKVQRKAVGIRLWTGRKELRGKKQGIGLGDSVADPGCLSRIPDPIFSIPDPNCLHPGSQILIKELKYFNPKKPKKWGLRSKKYDLGCSSRIPDPDADFQVQPIPDPGSRGQKGTQSRIPDPDPQHCLETLK
jgi:hypothetical protein